MRRVYEHPTGLKYELPLTSHLGDSHRLSCSGKHRTLLKMSKLLSKPETTQSRVTPQSTDEPLVLTRL